MHLPCNPESSCNASVIAYLNDFRREMLTQLAPVLDSNNGGAFLQVSTQECGGRNASNWLFEAGHLMLRPLSALPTSALQV